VSGPLSGELQVDPSLNAAHFKIQIFDNSRREVIAEASPSSLGTFDIRSCPTGIFEVRVVTQDGTIVKSFGISLPMSTNLTINLQGPPAAIGRPISISRMQHKVPKKAITEYRKAYAAIEKANFPEATTRLEAAIRLDPQFFEAANNLGALYLRERRLSEAFEMFSRAVSIDSADPAAEANLAFVLLRLNRFNEAEDATRASIRADALSARGRFLLAVSLLEQKKDRKEAIFHLT